jgi:hypothetical protein
MREPVEEWFNLAVHRGTCMDEDMDAFGGCYTACMKRCVDDCRRDPAAYMPWRPGGCIAECDELCFAECRPADIDMEPADWE